MSPARVKGSRYDELDRHTLIGLAISSPSSRKSLQSSSSFCIGCPTLLNASRAGPFASQHFFPLMIARSLPMDFSGSGQAPVRLRSSKVDIDVVVRVTNGMTALSIAVVQ